MDCAGRGPRRPGRGPDNFTQSRLGPLPTRSPRSGSANGTQTWLGPWLREQRSPASASPKLTRSPPVLGISARLAGATVGPTGTWRVSQTRQRLSKTGERPPLPCPPVGVTCRRSSFRGGPDPEHLPQDPLGGGALSFLSLDFPLGAPGPAGRPLGHLARVRPGHRGGRALVLPPRGEHTGGWRGP